MIPEEERPAISLAWLRSFFVKGKQHTQHQQQIGTIDLKRKRALPSGDGAALDLSFCCHDMVPQLLTEPD
jgi:hypothetical protein